MGRAQFEYDEVGNTFYYVVSVFALAILIPLTYVLWPSARKLESCITRICNEDVNIFSY